jgi:hypothetical protein
MTILNEQKVENQLERLRNCYWHLTAFSGIEIDLTNGLLYAVCQKYGLKTQERFLSTILSSIAALNEEGFIICIRMSCLQHIHLITHSHLLYSPHITMIHLVDVRPSFLKHFSLLRLLTHFDGTNPSLEHTKDDVLLYHRNQFPLLSNHFGLGLKKSAIKADSRIAGDSNSHPASVYSSDSSSTSSSQQQHHQVYSSSMPTIMFNTTQDSLRPPSPIRRATSPRRTGFQDDYGVAAGSSSDNGASLSAADSPYRLLAWGWIILSSTWCVFIVGAGSVLGLFSKKHVTPHDDELTGYPIPDYYPSLLFLCIVVACVWCIISWMGMKFFRHAKGGSS